MEVRGKQEADPEMGEGDLRTSGVPVHFSTFTCLVGMYFISFVFIEMNFRNASVAPENLSSLVTKSKSTLVTQLLDSLLRNLSLLEKIKA